MDLATLLYTLIPTLLAAYGLHRFILKQRLAVLEARLSDQSTQTEKLTQQAQSTQQKADSLQEKLSQSERLLEASRAEHKALLEHSKDKIQFLEKTHSELEKRFSELSAKALKSNQSDFLELAKSTFEKLHEGAQNDLKQRQKHIENAVAPISKTLENFDQKLASLEKTRTAQEASLSTQIKSLLSAHTQLQGETQKLSQALRAPNVRGQWGEMQLKRTVELAGMIDHVDFNEQHSMDSENGRLRPDMVIHLPNNNHLVVDAKAPLQAYLEANESENADTQREKLSAHARHLKNHLTHLGSKAYWKELEGTPEFVVLFLPGETFFSAALQADPTLIDFGASKRVILATPTTLIALLKAIAYGWKQASVAEEARAISELGSTLYERFHTFANHFADLRKHLGRSVEAYNKTLRSAETRVLPTARKFQNLSLNAAKELPDTAAIEATPSNPQAEELQA